MSNITSVSIPAQKEIHAANSSIAQIRDFQSKNWAIGLNGDTLAPDGFLAFFTERHLPFSYYVRAKGVNVGEPSAYQTNIATLTQYIGNIRAAETTAVNSVIAELEVYKARNWAIGLNGSTLQPDGFLPFFDTRSIPFAYYVRSGSVDLGSPDAYDVNIKALQRYLAEV